MKISSNSLTDSNRASNERNDRPCFNVTIKCILVKVYYYFLYTKGSESTIWLYSFNPHTSSKLPGPLKITQIT